MQYKGISLSQLRPKHYDEFKGPCTKPITQLQQKMRHEHYEKKRCERAFAVLQKRAELVAQDEAGLREAKKTDDGPALSTMILMERERVAIAKKRMLDRNEQLAEHENKLSTIKAEKKKIIAAAEAKNKADKLQAIKDGQKKDIERAKRAAEFKAETLANFEAYYKNVHDKAAEAKKKDDQRQADVAERRRLNAQKAADRSAATQKRIEDCLESDRKNLEDRRERYAQKQKFLGMRQAEKDEIAAIEKIKSDQALADKKAFIAATAQQARDIEAKRIQDYHDKKADYQRRMDLKKIEDDKEAEIAAEALAAKHKQQLDTRLEAENRRENLRQSRIKRGEDAHERFEEYQAEVAMARLLHKEEMYLNQCDREEYRAQHDNIMEHQRLQLLARINRDTSVFENGKRDQKMLLDERHANRKQALIDKVVFDLSTPGPGEYESNKDHVPIGGKFGTKPEPPAERDNPGPAAYIPNMDTVLHCAGKVKFGTNKNKTALDYYIENFGKIPAPNHYDIDRDLKAPCMLIPTGKVMGPLEQMMKAAAGVPAPHDYGNPYCDVVEPMDHGWTFAKCPLPDPRNTPQRLNPAPNQYDINMFGTWGQIKTASLGTSGDRSYLEALQAYTSKIPGPGAYGVEVASRNAALAIDSHPNPFGPMNPQGVSPADKAAMSKLLNMRLNQSQSPVALAKHVAINCARSQ